MDLPCALRLASIVVLGAAAGCGGDRAPAARTPSTAPTNTVALERELRRELDSLRQLRFVGMDDGPVPDFELRAKDGTRLNSRDFLGREPFVVAFVATWCDVCERKLASLRRALEQVGPMVTIPVMADGPETWSKVDGYLAEFGIRQAPVAAAEHPAFALAYNPFATVPLLVIVGRNGGLVDYQLGDEPEHDARLVASLELARTIAPLVRPTARAPR